jgi:hypothetical protein
MSHLTRDEERLLVELKAIVAARAAEAAPAGATVHAPRRYRRGLVLALAAVAALAAALAVLPGLLADNHPAFAAEREPDGSIRIQIWEYWNAKGLGARLRSLGVNAVVDVIPNGQRCRQPRAAQQDPASGRVLQAAEPRHDEMGAFILHPELIKPGETFVLEITVTGDPRPGHNASMYSTDYIAIGPVAPCDPVSGPKVVGPDGSVHNPGPGPS